VIKKELELILHKVDTLIEINKTRRGLKLDLSNKELTILSKVIKEYLNQDEKKEEF
jgi:hypothetical protein